MTTHDKPSLEGLTVITDSERARLLERRWKEHARVFNYPAIDPPMLVEQIPVPCDTAYYDYKDRYVCLSDSFLTALREQGMEDRTSIDAILEHEIGHYVGRPRELSTHLDLLAQAMTPFGDLGDDVYAFFIDLAVEGWLYGRGISGKSLNDLRTSMAKKFAGHPEASIHRIMLALYDASFPSLRLGTPELDERETAAFDSLRGLDYITPTNDRLFPAMYRFGHGIKPFLEEAKQQRSGNAQEPGPGNTASGLGDETSIDGIPIEDIERALDDILREHGKHRFERAQRYVRSRKKEYPQRDVSAQSDKNHTAGLEDGEFALHDELIPLYDRWARSHGVHIAKRAYVVDKEQSVTSGLRPWEPGDPLHTISATASRGLIGIPGITLRRDEEPEIVPSREQRVPHANIGLDTSGSMDRPDTSSGSASALAACILAHTYHRNGSFVGAWNFSTQIAYNGLSRDLRAAYSILLGYWGGGTHLNTEKLAELLRQLHIGGDPRVTRQPQFMGEPVEIDRALRALTPEEQRLVTEKDLRIDAPAVRERYEKVDQILITDGYIWNLEETLTHLGAMGKVTRNFVFLTHEHGYEQWKGLSLPNTWVYKATTPQDLVRGVLGTASKAVHG